MQFSHTLDIISLLEGKYQNLKMLKQINPQTKEWEYITGLELANNAITVAKALAKTNIEVQECIGIYSPNKSEFLYSQLGAFLMKAVVVPLYATFSPDQVHFICCDANIKLIFVGEQYQYNNAYQVQKEKGQIERIVIFDKNVVRQFDDKTSIYYDDFIKLGDSMSSETKVKVRRGDISPEDLALIIYTSGTTGKPKGATVKHKAILSQIKEHKIEFPFIGKKDVSLNFLPLSHIFENIWVCLCLAYGAQIAIITNPKQVLELLPKIKPSLMCNVPRFWEKVYQGVQKHINDSPTPIAKLLRRAIRVGHKLRLEYWNENKRGPFILRFEYGIYKHTIFYLLKKKIGLQNGKLFPTGGSLLNDEIVAFLHSVGIPIIVGYGLSETCATVSAFPCQGFKLGSIGKVFPNVKVRIDPQNGEIQLKGETVTEGYYNDEEATKNAFTNDGWFKSGDIGYLEDGHLFFTERLKDLFKTANGKYIAPQQIENLLAQDELFEQAIIIADGYKFASALIYPNWDLLKNKIVEKGLATIDTPIEELVKNRLVNNFIMAKIEELQAGLASFEKIKRITLITAPFSTEKGEITDTLKLKRKIIYKNYAQAIEDMYSND